MLEVDITPRAAADIVWLEHALGRRYRGYEIEEGEFRVTIVRSSGKQVWCFGPSLEKAVGVARRVVQVAMKEAR